MHALKEFISCYVLGYSTIIKTWMIIWMGASHILSLHPRTLKYLKYFTISKKKTFKMSAKSKKQESQELLSDEESGSEYECSDSGEESDEEMEVSEESEVDEDLVVVSNLFIII